MAGVDAGSSYGTNTTTYASTIKTKWQLELLKSAEGYLVADKFANTQVMGRGEGGTLVLNRLLRPAKQTTSSSAGYLYDYDDAKALTSNKIEVTPTLWGDSFGFTDVEDIQSFITMPQNREIIARQMAQSFDYQVMKALATGSMRHRIDKDTSYQVSGTATSGTTTTLVNTGALAEADSAWVGGYLTIVNPGGANYDIAAIVTASDQSSTNVTVGTQPQAYGSTSKYRLTVGTGIAATDKMTVTGLLDVSALHRKLQTPKFKGGIYRMFMDAAQERDIWDDTIFTDTAKYDDSERYASYSVGRWLDIEFLVSSEMYREDVNGTENQATGVVYVAPIFGADSYSVVRWGMGQGDFGAQFIVVDQPDSGNLRSGMKWLSWKAYFAAKVLRATSSIGLMTGATSLNVVL